LDQEDTLTSNTGKHPQSQEAIGCCPEGSQPFKSLFYFVNTRCAFGGQKLRSRPEIHATLGFALCP
jgi:hypothetical protein